MKSLINRSLKFMLPALFLLAAATANAQQRTDAARLHFENLNKLEARAQDVVEVNIDGKMLEMAKRVMVKTNDADAKRVGEAISGLKGIYVRIFNFEKENEYDAADVDQIRAQLRTPDWERLANVRSKKDNQKIDVFTRFAGDVMSGLAVVISDSKSITLVNVVGTIDIDMLAELGGKLNIPQMDIENGKGNQPKPKH